MAKRIELKRAAGEKRQEAQKKLAELQETLEKQVNEELDADSRLTAEEISQRRGEIADLQAEAKEIEKVVDTKDVFEREDDLDAEAKRIRNEAGHGKDSNEFPFDEGFKGLNNFLRAIRTIHGNYDNPMDVSDSQKRAIAWAKKTATQIEKGERIPTKDLGDAELKTLVGDDSGSTGRGDYLVPTVHMTELLRVMGESQQFANRARRIPMSRRTADFPRLKQTDATDTRPFFSFAAVTKIAEGAQKPEREPVFEQLTLTAIKYAAYVEASDELLSDSIVDLPPVLIELLTSAIAYEYDRDTIRGSGSSEPQGFIGSNAEYAVNRQASNDVQLTDIFNMEQRLFGDDAVYMYHPSIIPDLYGLQSNNIIVWNPNLADGVPGTLLGRPLVKSHKLPSLGTKGDFALVDPSFYLVGDLQRVTVANSIHYQFRNDVTAWRATFRAAGTPWPAGTFSHESDGSNKTFEISPFVVLDVPAT